MKSSASIYKSSGSQFFRTTAEIQLGPGAFDKSVLVTEICSFGLVLEGKAGKKIPESLRLEFLEKFLANNSALLDAEDITPGPLNKENVENTREPIFWEVINSFVLLAYASLAATRTFLQ